MKKHFTTVVLLLFGMDLFSQLSLEKAIILGYTERQIYAIDKNLFLIGTKGNFKEIILNDQKKGMIGKDEEISYLNLDDLFTIKKDPYCHFGGGQLELSKYSFGGSLLKESSMVYPCFESSISHFSDGSFLIKDEGEEGGYEFKFFDNDLKYVNSHIPFEKGYHNSHHSTSGNLLFLAANPKDLNKRPEVFLLTNKGELLFRKSMNGKSELLKVKSSKKYFAVYSFSSHTDLHQIHVFDRPGSTVWSKEISNQVENWSFLTDTPQKLLVADRDQLVLHSIDDGAVLYRKPFSRIFQEGGFRRSRNDHYLEIIEVTNFDKGFAVLLSEPKGLRSFKNNILYMVRDIEKSEESFTLKLDDSNVQPSLMNTGGEMHILLDNKILSYGQGK